ncbi:FtsK/SpoIIIE domain-containing protein [Streptomycetaceae bacterium NBC_01309]
MQSLVAGLAAGNRPDEMVFVLIDHKGGAAFKDCVDLPHTLGMVTDLDPHLTERALTSIGAELRRRETTLVTMSASLLACGTRAILVTPRDTPLRALVAHPHVVAHLPGADLAEQPLLDALARAEGAPVVVVVDDADMHTNCLADPVLRGIVASGRDRGTALVYAGVSEVVTQHMFGWLGEARRARSGALIAPQTIVEGDLLGVRLSPDAVRGQPRPGRAVVVDPATGGTLTICLPNTSARVV